MVYWIKSSGFKSHKGHYVPKGVTLDSKGYWSKRKAEKIANQRRRNGQKVYLSRNPY